MIALKSLLTIWLFGLVISCSVMVEIIKMVDEKRCIKDGEIENMSFLQQHAAYFDINKDGIIYPWETFAGLRALGYNVLLSPILTIAINGIFSYPTLPTWIPSLLFPLYVANIHKGKHGSDTGNYDYDGKFIRSNFENMVNKYANTEPDKLTFGELWKMTEDHRVVLDLFGWFSAKLEFGLLYFLVRDEDGFVSKEAFYQVYDGTLFYNVAKEQEKKVTNGINIE